jgi:pimeloyl-ACP methyl ester carboxylesterase
MVTRVLLGAALVAVGAIALSRSQGDACATLRAPEARCLIVSVPENRTTGRGRTIPIRVAVLTARGPDRAPDPIFVLAGGPGSAATGSIGRYRNDPRRDRRDVVFADQRGTGGSNSLSCPFYMPEDAARGVFPDFMPVARVRECRATLESRADLAQYTTTATVADLDDVRKALGYDRINLEGGSYGTRLAMEYVRAHGAHVRSVLLDGVVPPGLVMPDGFGRTAQRALDGIILECAATPSCAAAFPDLRRRSVEVFDRLKKIPATVPSKGSVPAFTMTRDNVAEALRYMTYSNADAARVPLLLHRAHDGDFSGFADFLRAFRGDGSFDGLYLSITCAEDVTFVPPDAAAREGDTYLGDYRIRQQQGACAEWPRGAARGSMDVVRSDVPALLITGLLDPVTSPTFNDVVAAGLRNAVNLKVPSGAHGLRGMNDLPCVQGIKRAFVEQGSGAGIDTSCVARMTRAGFALR